jgi:hypothetical protein
MSSGGPPKPKPIPKAAPTPTAEDESVKSAGDAERRRIAAMASRKNTVTSSRNAQGYKTVTGI